jgi:outer membrane protein TolC
MKQYIKQSILLIATLSGFVSGNAQDSLSYYLEQSALNNPGVKAKYLEYSAALEKAPQASSLPDPELQFGYFIESMQLLGGNQVADIRLMQMFPWFGVLKSAKDEASKMAVAKFENFRDAKGELYFNVKSSYYKIYRTKYEIGIARKNLDILKSLEQIVLVKFSTGDAGSSSGNSGSMPAGSNNSSPGSSGMSGGSMTNQSRGSGSVSSFANKLAMTSSGGGVGSSMGGSSKNDMVNLLRVQIEIHELENRIALLQDQLTTDKVSFNMYLNRAPLSEVFIGDSLKEVPVPEDILTLADSLVNHPMVKMYEAESDANAAKLTMVTRMGYPMVGLGLNYSVIQKREGIAPMMNGNDMIMPMISLTLPIYRKKYKAMRHEAEFMKDAATVSAENVTNNLRVNFQETMQNLNDAGRRVNLYTEQALLAYKSVQLLLTSFSANGSDFEEILRMEQQLLDYQFKQVEAVVDKNTSIARLVYLTGN